jgi:parallel beta-helix repeat protein
MVKMLKTIGGIAAGATLLAGMAHAQSLGGFPIREPGATKPGQSGSGGAKPSGKGPMQIIVDANGPGPYKTISAAIKDVGEGGMVYVMHGVYNESLSVTRSVFIQGDRGPGPGVEIVAPMNASCMSFTPNVGTSHAVVANVTFQSKINSRSSGCVEIGSGVFTLKESNVLGSTLSPAVRVSGGTAVLEKNRISGGSEGVVVDQNHTLSQTFIVDNKIGGNKVGVDISNGSRSDVVVSGNEIFDNLETGVKSSGYGQATLIGNKIRNNKGTGVVLDKYSKLALVRYNEIVKNNGDGVAVPFGANGLIEDNQIVGNSGISIYVREGLAPKITNNIISNNGGDTGKKKKRSRRES